MQRETHQSSPQPGLAPDAITLAFIGGDRLTRGAIAGLLDTRGELEVRGTFASTTHFLASDPVGPIEVLLLDCDEDLIDRWSAVSVLCHVHASSKIVMLCREVSPEVIRCAMQHRVGGVILKSYSAEDIGEAIRYMASGRTIMPAGWQRAVGALHREQLTVSPRLRQILALLAQGKSNEQIATELELSPNTIKVHVRALYSQLGVRNRVEAARVYTQMAGSAA